jgi:hypothetical protein
MWYLRVLRGRPLSCMTSRWCSRDAGDPPSSERTLDSFGRTVPLGPPRSRPVVSGKHDFLTSLLGFVLVIRKLGRPGPAGHLVGVVRHDRHAGGPAGAGDRLAVAQVGEAAPPAPFRHGSRQPSVLSGVRHRIRCGGTGCGPPWRDAGPSRWTTRHDDVAGRSLTGYLTSTKSLAELTAEVTAFPDGIFMLRWEPLSGDRCPLRHTVHVRLHLNVFFILA